MSNKMPVNTLLDIAPTLRDIDEQVEHLDDALLSGQAADIADYKYMVGQRRGLIITRNSLVIRADEQHKESDDDND